MTLKQPEKIGEDETPIPLMTLGDVERALAKVLRQSHKGTLPLNVAHMMIIGLGTLAKVKQDARDSRWTKRAEVMWKDRQAKQTADAASEEAH